MDRPSPFHLTAPDSGRMPDALARAAIDSLSMPIVILDAAGTIIYCNHRFAIALGYPGGELIKYNIGALFDFPGYSRQPARVWPDSATGLSDQSRMQVVVRRADGSTFTAEAAVRAVQSDTPAACFVCVLHDAAAPETSVQREAERTRTDVLTGAYGRPFVLESLHRAIQHSRGGEQIVAALFIDLDGFKGVNDLHGHWVGDELLRAVTSRLQGGVRASDVVGRYGGDEFVIVLPALAARQVALDIGRQLLAQLAQPFSLGRVSVSIGASVGLAFCPDHGHDVRTILMRADQAMYRGKRRGGGAVTLAENRCSLVSRGPVRCIRAPAAGFAPRA